MSRGNKNEVSRLFIYSVALVIWLLGGLTMAEVPNGSNPTPAGGSEFELTWLTIDGGGGTGSGNGFDLSGTIGQPDAGAMTGGDFEMTGGFWFAVVAGDCNADGAVSIFDYDDYTDCVTGAQGGPPAPGCECFDFESDNDVDLIDFAALQSAFNG